MNLRQFISSPGKVVITDRVANVNRIMRRWNRYDGMDFVDCQVMSVPQIAKEIVTAFAAVYEPDKRYRIITPAMSTMIMQVILKKQKLLSVPDKSKCTKTAEEILRSLNRIRLNDPTEEFDKETDIKLAEMKELLRLYEEWLMSNNELDHPMLIIKAKYCLDFINASGNSAEKLSCLLPWISRDIGIVDGIKLTAKEESFLDALEMAADKSFVYDLGLSEEDLSGDINDRECGDIHDSNGGVSKRPDYHFFESYGIDGEVRYVADKIREERIPYGDVLIIYASEAYENMLRGELDANGISFAFPQGYHAASEDYITFMLDLIFFVNDDYSYESLGRVVYNPLFNITGRKRSYRSILREGIGWGRKRYEEFIAGFEAAELQYVSRDIKKEDNNKEEDNKITERRAYKKDKTDEQLNADGQGSIVSDDYGLWRKEEAENRKLFVGFIKNILAVFEENNSCEKIFSGLVELTNAYTYKADRTRINLSTQLKAQSRAFSVIGIDEPFDSRLVYITDYLGNLRLKEAETPDAVAIYPYGVPVVTDRNYLFVLGLSNENVSGTRTESPVFSDDELLRYAVGELDLARDCNAENRRRFEQTLKVFGGRKVYIGYSDYDTVKLLDNSRSLIYTDLLRQAGCREDDIEKTGYSLINGSIILTKDDFYRAYTNTEEAEKNGSVTDAYFSDEKIEEDAENGKDNDNEEDNFTPMYFSASSLQTLLYCPLQFYYKKIEHVPDIQHARRTPDRWLQANQKGNLFHRTMEDYVNKAFIEDNKKAVDRALLEAVFNEKLKLAQREQPCPSQHIFEEEKTECFDAVIRYAEKLHNEINASDKDKKVIGCEVEFKDHAYSGGAVYPDENGVLNRDLRYDVYFSGSADRVDGYVEDEILNIEIADYKTGSSDRKIAEIKEGVQIQHYIYAICIKKWAEDNKEDLEKRFRQKINGCRIVAMNYVFPFEEGDSAVDASGLVNDDNLELPGEVDRILGLVVGNMQHGDMEGAMDFMEEYVSGKMEEAAAQDKDADYCRYCSYKDVCRKRL